MPEEKKNTRMRLSWDEWYRLAKQYRDTYGDLLIPQDYICPGGQRLGRWIERQRARYNDVASIDRRLYDDEIHLLDEIDMVWKLEHRAGWKDWLTELDWYRGIYGDLNVPKDFCHGRYGLGNWIVKQRMAYAEGKLSASQIDDLNARGMIWNVRTRPREWNEWFIDAEDYFNSHGNLNVPLGYLTGDGRKLGRWISTQRDIYRGRKAGRRLSPEQVELLEGIGMVWNPGQKARESWDEMYACVCDYRLEHGRLPLWPGDLKSPDGRSLPGWIRTQRTALAKGNVPRERAERLAAIGIVAALPRSAQEQAWEEMYASVADYLRRNGRLPATHRHIKSPDGRLMSRWITLQRRNMAVGKLSEDRMRRLATLGIT